MQVSGGRIEYRECGLDNVILENVPTWRCDHGHVDAQVPAIDSLHLVIARALIMLPWPLKGQDVRFLRKYLGYSAREFSRHLGLNHVTLSRFENDRTRVPRKLEALVRLFCAQAICERHGAVFPQALIAVLEALEDDRIDVRADLHVEHLGLAESEAMTEPSHAWRSRASV